MKLKQATNILIISLALNQTFASSNSNVEKKCNINTNTNKGITDLVTASQKILTNADRCEPVTTKPFDSCHECITDSLTDKKNKYDNVYKEVLNRLVTSKFNTSKELDKNELDTIIDSLGDKFFNESLNDYGKRLLKLISMKDKNTCKGQFINENIRKELMEELTILKDGLKEDNPTAFQEITDYQFTVNQKNDSKTEIVEVELNKIKDFYEYLDTFTEHKAYEELKKSCHVIEQDFHRDQINGRKTQKKNGTNTGISFSFSYNDKNSKRCTDVFANKQDLKYHMLSTKLLSSKDESLKSIRPILYTLLGRYSAGDKNPDNVTMEVPTLCKKLETIVTIYEVDESKILQGILKSHLSTEASLKKQINNFSTLIDRVMKKNKIGKSEKKKTKNRVMCKLINKISSSFSKNEIEKIAKGNNKSFLKQLAKLKLNKKENTKYHQSIQTPKMKKVNNAPKIALNKAPKDSKTQTAKKGKLKAQEIATVKNIPNAKNQIASLKDGEDITKIDITNIEGLAEENLYTENDNPQYSAEYYDEIHSGNTYNDSNTFSKKTNSMKNSFTENKSNNPKISFSSFSGTTKNFNSKIDSTSLPQNRQKTYYEEKEDQNQNFSTLETPISNSQSESLQSSTLSNNDTIDDTKYDSKSTSTLNKNDFYNKKISNAIKSIKNKDTNIDELEKITGEAIKRAENNGDSSQEDELKKVLEELNKLKDQNITLGSENKELKERLANALKEQKKKTSTVASRTKTKIQSTTKYSKVKPQESTIKYSKIEPQESTISTNSSISSNRGIVSTATPLTPLPSNQKSTSSLNSNYLNQNNTTVYGYTNPNQENEIKVTKEPLLLRTKTFDPTVNQGKEYVQYNGDIWKFNDTLGLYENIENKKINEDLLTKYPEQEAISLVGSTINLKDKLVPEIIERSPASIKPEKSIPIKGFEQMLGEAKNLE